MHIFDGRAKAEDIESRLRGRTPKTNRVLHSIVVGDDSRAMAYQRMKEKAAKKVGCTVSIFQFPDTISFEELGSNIKKWNSDPSVDGIMIQLPLPENLRHKTKDLIDSIIQTKDVDGMREDSPFIAPVVNAVMIALDEAEKNVRQPLKARPLKEMKTLVVGSSGFVGQKIVRHLSDKNYIVVGVDEGDYLDPCTLSADVIISVTGVENLIKPDMVKEGVILIDVGSPRGDIDKKAYDKASFVSPVPGGIGPVTIACLLQNLIET